APDSARTPLRKDQALSQRHRAHGCRGGQHRDRRPVRGTATPVCVVAALLVFVVSPLAGPKARAEGDAASDPRLFLRPGRGRGFTHESGSPSGGSPGATYAGWGPALEVAVGRRVRPRLVIAADLQLAMIVDRTESFLGASYPLTETLHFLDSL